MNADEDVIHTRIWEETPEADNPFAAAACYCAGFDVFGDLLGKVSWIEYLYLLFRQEPPTAPQAALLEGLAVAVANPGPRDHSVRAAMSAGVGGSTQAACLTAALAVGAGQLGGAREVRLAMENWQACGRDLSAWTRRLSHPPRQERADIWPEMEHPPGFDPYGASCAAPVRQALAYLTRCSSGDALQWFAQYRLELEGAADCPAAMTGVAAAALIDLGFDPAQGEMLYLLLRLPGAAAHALEQRAYGYKRYPFFKTGLVLTDDPGPGPVSGHDRREEQFG
jgi:citrate synthase